jgi:glutathione S-transferase
MSGPEREAYRLPPAVSFPLRSLERVEIIHQKDAAMKLYYAPLACSLADHIALIEAGVPFDRESVDLRTKRTASGADFNLVTPKGYVPALALDNGEVLTETIAILDWIATQHPALGVAGYLGRTRLLEALAFISTEIHRSFRPLWHGDNEIRARLTVSSLLHDQADVMVGDYLFGATPSVADFYLFVMLLWSERFEVGIPAPLIAMRERMAHRPSVKAALLQEGLISLLERERASLEAS